MFENIFRKQGRSTLIDAAFDDISAMLTQSYKMMKVAVPALLDNVPVEVDINSMDDQVDEGERMVRRTVLEHLSVNPTQDLVVSLVLVSMVQDAERVGDFSSGILKLTAMAKSPREGHFAERLRTISNRIEPLFGLCEAAFREDDRDKANELISTHHEVRKELQEYTRAVADSDLSADMAVVYSSAASMLRRISAHLSNIASSVVQPYDRIRHGDEDV
jgi:phosphate uptake regulator